MGLTLEESLKLERYKLVTDRQRYFTELAKESFTSYVRFLTALSAVAVAVVSARNRLDLRLETVLYLVQGILILVTFLGLVAAAQIVFCLWRWNGYRRAEAKINADCPPLDSWWWVFEILYVVAILFSIGLVRCMFLGLPARLSATPPGSESIVPLGSAGPPSLPASAD